MRPTPPEKLRLGGMALGNGLLVHGPTHWATAVRDARGELHVTSGPKPELGGDAVERVPGLRGVIKLAEALAVIPLVKRALPEARLPMQEPKTIGTMVAAALAGQAVRRRGGPGRTLGREALTAGIGVVPALLALRGGDLAAYHGVEHKAIAAYEEGDEHAADAAKEHDRCGSHLVAPLLASATAGNVAVRRERRVRRRGVRARRAPSRHRDGARPAPAGLRDPARARHARADRGAARGR